MRSFTQTVLFVFCVLVTIFPVVLGVVPSIIAMGLLIAMHMVDQWEEGAYWQECADHLNHTMLQNIAIERHLFCQDEFETDTAVMWRQFDNSADLDAFVVAPITPTLDLSCWLWKELTTSNTAH